MSQKTIIVHDSEVTRRIFGSFDRNLARLESEFSVRIYNRQDPSGIGDAIHIEGADDAVARASEAVKYLKKIASLGEELSDQSVDYIIGMVSDGRTSELGVYDEDCLFVTAKGKPITWRSETREILLIN